VKRLHIEVNQLLAGRMRDRQLRQLGEDETFLVKGEAGGHEIFGSREPPLRQVGTEPFAQPVGGRLIQDRSPPQCEPAAQSLEAVGRVRDGRGRVDQPPEPVYIHGVRRRA
jgi:hypothetical protein